MKRILALAVLSLAGAGLLAGCGDDVEDDVATRAVAGGSGADMSRLAELRNPDSTVGQLVYVPVYSSAFHQSGSRRYPLTATLSVHNVDLERDIELTAVIYLDTHGDPVSTFLREPVTVPPLSTRQFVIPDTDDSGGTGANFLVRWESRSTGAEPLVEALMISTSGQQGLSFTTRGVVVRELR